MIIRQYLDSDLEQIIEIADRAWEPIIAMRREALGDRISARYRTVSKGMQVKAQIDSGEYNIRVCEHENRIVGFITFRIAGEWGTISNNAARPHTGLKGIGQLMYQDVLQIFKAAHVKTVQVTTGLDPAHAPARRAYERAGFHRYLDSRTYFLDLEEEAKS